MGSFNLLCFLWLIIGCVIGFGAGILYLFLMGSSPEIHDRPNKSRLPFSLTLLRGGWTVVTLIAIAGVCHDLKLEKTVTILILMAAVLLIAKLAGPTYGLAASLLAVGLVAYFFLPPVGSFRVYGGDNQLALMLFLLTTAAGSRLVGGRRGLRG